MEVVILPSHPIPKENFSKKRNQYNGAEINRHLVNKYLAKNKRKYFRLLAFISKDQWAGNFNFVFGICPL